jgi:hypothetical protein
MLVCRRTLRDCFTDRPLYGAMTVAERGIRNQRLPWQELIGRECGQHRGADEARGGISRDESV